MNLKRMQHLDVNGKRVLVRFDLNVPMDDDERVTETTRLTRVKPTIDYLRAHNAKVIIMAHLGRPIGHDTALSLQKIVDACSEAWGCDVKFSPTSIGEEAQNNIAGMQNGDVLLLENIRFQSGEEKNDPAFARELAGLGDVYINDGFSVSHRAHASTEGIAHYLPSAAGLSMQAEIDAIAASVENPVRPVMAIIGGSKVSTKIAVLENLVSKVDFLVIGGGMANTFLLAQGHDIGASLAEPDLTETAKKVLRIAKEKNCTIILPTDVAASFSLDAPTEIYNGSTESLPAGYKIFDIGEQSIMAIKNAIAQCKTVLWNGPVGVFERPPFDHGTVQIARAIAQDFHERKITTVAGGGDTLSAIDKAGLKDEDFTYLSTAGGAFLEWLEGKELPGVKILLAGKK